MSKCRIDFETRSDVDLIKHGVYVYTDSPHCDCLMAAYQIDDGPVQTWLRGQPCPDDLRVAVESGCTIHAHNAAFERIMWWRIMTPRYGWPLPAIEQFVCTAVAAAAMSLPRSLDRLGVALDLNVKKDKKGKALIKRHSIPQGFGHNGGSPIWDDDTDSLNEFLDYCKTDLLTEREAGERLIPLSADEQAVYALSERINDRGVRIDVTSARAALVIAEKAKDRINKELAEVTGYYVTAVTQVAAMQRWLTSRGVEMPTLDKDEVEDVLLLCDDLPDDVRRALELRQEGAKPSVDKIGTMLDRVGANGRACGSYLHHGAGQTGRFSARGLQVHNMPKYRKVFESEFEKGRLELSTLFGAIRTGEPEALELLYGSDIGRPLHLLSDAVRSFIWAEPGHEFHNADFTSIEGVKAAWFANEQWKLQAFRDLIDGTGPGMYELLASSIYSVPVAAVTKPQRSVGKVGELSMGYQGGCGALARMARANKLKLPSIFDSVWSSADGEAQEKAEKRFEERVAAHDDLTQKLGREGWIAAELVKVGWRAKHPAIVAAWKALEDAATQAVAEPETVVPALDGKVAYVVRHGFLWCRLPSGRCLAYGRPRMDTVDAPWADKTLEPEKREKKRGLTVLGVGDNERWSRFSIYGGSLFNNVVQGSSRDILTHGMQNAEAVGYPIVLHTHDEAMSELPIGQGSHEAFSTALCDLPSWCRDLPLKAAGWTGKRYAKR